jgi:flagellar export protein FliJ
MSLSAARLKKLVKHREHLERIEEGNLAAELRQQATRQRALAASRTQRESLFAAGTPAAGRLDVTALVSGAACVVRFGRDIDARLAALAHSEGLVEAQREVLLARRRDRKAMQSLLDHRLEEERLERNRLERKHIDELAGVRWHRQHR